MISQSQYRDLNGKTRRDIVQRQPTLYIEECDEVRMESKLGRKWVLEMCVYFPLSSILDFELEMDFLLTGRDSLNEFLFS